MTVVKRNSKIKSISQLENDLIEVSKHVDMDHFAFETDVKFDPKTYQFVAPQLYAKYQNFSREVTSQLQLINQFKDDWMLRETQEQCQQALANSGEVKKL